MTLHTLASAGATLVEQRLYPQSIEYPDSDGQPMGETGLHVRATLCIYSGLREVFRDRHDVYIAADMFLYYEEGNPRAQLAPDVMVMFGVKGSHERRSFKTWAEGAAPAVVFEVTSRSTMLEDTITKSILYARLGVQEYILFDPLDEYLEGPVRALTLQDGVYAPLALNADGTLTSNVLAVTFVRQGHLLRVVHPKTGKIIPWVDDFGLAVEEFEQRLQQAEHRAEEAEQRVEEAEQRTEEAERRAASVETENARLRAQLDELRSQRDRPTSPQQT